MEGGTGRDEEERGGGEARVTPGPFKDNAHLPLLERLELHLGQLERGGELLPVLADGLEGLGVLGGRKDVIELGLQVLGVREGPVGCEDKSGREGAGT